MEVHSKKTLRVELFEVKMPTNDSISCSACETVQSKLALAIREVQNLFHHLNCEILFSTNIVKTVEDASNLEITASPTIRVGNFDFYPKHLTDNTEEREWIWTGLKVAEPSKAILIEVLLRGYFEQEKRIGKKEISPYILKNLTDSEMKKSNCGCK